MSGRFFPPPHLVGQNTCFFPPRNSHFQNVYFRNIVELARCIHRRPRVKPNAVDCIEISRVFFFWRTVRIRNDTYKNPLRRFNIRGDSMTNNTKNKKIQKNVYALGKYGKNGDAR